MHDESTMEPRAQVNVAAMAEIVRELAACDGSKLQDGTWLRERAKIAGLSNQEYAALEALWVHLRKQDALMHDASGGQIDNDCCSAGGK
jgi:hypothetical protein